MSNFLALPLAVFALAQPVQAPPAPPYSAALPNVPGATNPAVTQANIATTICVHGWTKTIRPPVSYTDRLKRSLMASEHLPGALGDYELDHDISLEIGGNPTDPNNLWMQRWHGDWNAHQKDAIETKLKRLVCSGTITLAEAQREISTDWVAAYRKWVKP